MSHKNRKIEIKGKEIGVTSHGKEDFICQPNTRIQRLPGW